MRRGDGDTSAGWRAAEDERADPRAGGDRSSMAWRRRLQKKRAVARGTSNAECRSALLFLARSASIAADAIEEQPEQRPACIRG